MTINELEPKMVWQFFNEICHIPRPSKKEDKIIQYLIDFGASHRLETKVDTAGNVLIKKPATHGQEKLMTVVLQSHVDMVCEKLEGVKHDFDVDPIIPIIDGEWVRAKDTTLGADDGIGIAAQLAVLADNSLKHGPIECLFTVDEETGLTGAKQLEADFLEGKILLNLDSEDEGVLFIGCAGGIGTNAVFPFKKKPIDKKDLAYRISISGLKGGHSGDDINKPHANAIKVLNRILWNLSAIFKIRIGSITGGKVTNAIPREASAIIMVERKHREAFESSANNLAGIIRKELNSVEFGFIFDLVGVDRPHFVINKAAQRKLLNSLYACPHGVIAWSQEIPGLVETSTNLAAVTFDSHTITVKTSQRSSVESAKYDIATMVANVFRLAEVSVVHTEGYPGWKPNLASDILKITKEAYRNLFEETPVVRAIHAGLECGLFLEKYKGLDMVSFGPTLQRVHTPEERINIPSTTKFWQLLLEVLRNIPNEKQIVVDADLEAENEAELKHPKHHKCCDDDTEAHDDDTEKESHKKHAKAKSKKVHKKKKSHDEDEAVVEKPITDVDEEKPSATEENMETEKSEADDE